MAAVPERLRKGSRIPGPPGGRSARSTRDGLKRINLKPAPLSNFGHHLQRPSLRPKIVANQREAPPAEFQDKGNAFTKDDASNNQFSSLEKRRDFVSDVIFDSAVNSAVESGLQLHDEMDNLERLAAISPSMEYTESGVYYSNGTNQDPIFIPKLTGVGDEQLEPEDCMVSIKRADLLDIKNWLALEQRLHGNDWTQ